METALTEHKSAARLSRGYIICLIATVFWSSTGVFIRYLSVNYHLPALVLAFWRDLFLTVFLGLVLSVIAPKLLRLDRRHARFMLTYGLVLSLFNSLWTLSVVFNGAAVSTVLAYSSAGFTAVLGWKLLHEKLGPIKVVAVTLSLLGCVFVSGAYSPAAWAVNPLGIFTGVVSGIAFASYSLMGKSASDRGINPWTVMVYAFGLAALFLLGFNLLAPLLPDSLASTNLYWLGGKWGGWLVLILLAIGPTVGGFGLYTTSLNYLPASVANIIATLEPPMTAALAFAFLGERFTLPQWVGSILIIAGVIVLRIGEQN